MTILQDCPDPKPWTAADLVAWEARLGLTTASAAALLGLTTRAYRRIKAGGRAVSLSTAGHAQHLEYLAQLQADNATTS